MFLSLTLGAVLLVFLDVTFGIFGTVVFGLFFVVVLVGFFGMVWETFLVYFLFGTFLV